MESAVTAAVSGHVKRVVVHEGESLVTKIEVSQMTLPHSGDSINQGDLTVEIAS